MKLCRVGGPQNDGLFREQNSEVIYVRKEIKGKKIFLSTRTTTLSIARVERDRIIAEVMGYAPTKVRRQFFSELWVKWVTGLKQSHRKATIQSIDLSFSHLSPFLNDTFVDDIDNNWWTSVYVADKRRASPKRKFFNDRKWLLMFLKWCKDSGHYPKDKDLPKLAIVDEKSTAGRCLTESEVEALLQHSSGTIHLQILMALTMGMRSSEICLLEKSRVDLDRKLIYLRSADTKTKKPRIVPISESVFYSLKKQIESNDTDFVFPRKGMNLPQARDAKNSAWNLCRKKAGVRCRFHDLRHTFLTFAFKTSTNPALICAYAGLSLEVANEVYLHFSPEDLAQVASIVKF